MDNWITMIKGDEEKLVHPGNVANHLRAGWQLKNQPIPAAADPDPSDGSQPVAVETPAESDDESEADEAESDS